MTTTVDCIWNQWHEWEQCSKSCGGGITSRTRNIKQYAQLGGQICVGDAFQTKECNNQTCPGTFKYCSSFQFHHAFMFNKLNNYQSYPKMVILFS